MGCLLKELAVVLEGRTWPEDKRAQGEMLTDLVEYVAGRRGGGRTW